MSAWLLRRPSSINDRHERYFMEVDGNVVRTTSREILAKRFHTAYEARTFANQHQGHFDEWTVVRR